jgi:hypothetical protein
MEESGDESELILDGRGASGSVGVSPTGIIAEEEEI